MKRLLPILGMICTLSSCIYDSPNDRFYRTLWISEESPFNNAEAVATYGLEDGGNYLSNGGRLTLEFLCDGNITVTATGAVGSYGSYDPYGATAYFASLELSYYINGSDTDRIVIVLEEAHRTNDLLLLSWHFADSPVSYTTRMVRKGSYD